MPARERYYRVRFQVTGAGRFPLDMLRHDRCCPERERDANLLDRDYQRTINLLRFTTAGGSGPNSERWKSFGWIVHDLRFE